MKILVCGGRDFDDQALVFKVLDSLAENEKPTHIVHGGARGADASAGLWAHQRKIQTCQCNANWLLLGKSAGVRRNVSMLQLLVPGTDIVVAFPGGTGTAHMKEIARKAGVEVVEANTVN